MRDISRIVVHTSASGFGNVKMIDEWHKARGWNGIGYHYVILNGRIAADQALCPALDGYLEFGRGLNVIGAHVRGHNTGSIGVCLIGMSGDFTRNQLFTLNALCRHWGVESLQHSDLASRKPYCAGLIKHANGNWALK